MPVTHEFSRTAAALGTALALIFLPFAGTIAPAHASLTNSAEVETSASAAGNTDSEAGDSIGDKNTEPAADDGNVNGPKDPDEPGDNEAKDKACSPAKEFTDGDPPCKTAEPLTATWGDGKQNPDQDKQTLKLTTPNKESGSMPESWVGAEFDGPSKDESARRWPVQSGDGSNGSSDSTTTAAESDGGTDDSGNPIPDAAAAPDKYSLNNDGYVVDADDPLNRPMKFEDFEEDPDWTFTSDGKSEENAITVEGKAYPPDNGASDSADADSDGTDDDGDNIASDDGEASADKDNTAGADGADSDTGSKNAKDSSSGNKANSSSSSDRTASSNSDSNSSSKASSDANSSDSAKADSKDADSSSSSDADSSKKNSDSDSSSSSDGSDSDSDSGNSDSIGDADNDGSSNKDGGKDDKDSADKNGSGTTSGDGGPDGKDTTPDPETGNGSSDTRDEIPGDVGDDWMPGNGESPPPDYSDPVPQNPDTPAPDDDTDLITGGDTPEPRSDKPPSTSFGESIVSTIASSWPIFILAASGMAAVGFIIWLVGRRNKQN